MLSTIKLPNGMRIHPKFMVLDTEQMVYMSFIEYQTLLAFLMSAMKILNKPGSRGMVENVNELLSILVADPTHMPDEAEATMTSDETDTIETVTDEQLKKDGYVTLETHLLKVGVNKVAEIRKKRGLSQRELGDMIGIDQSKISRFEKQPDKAPAGLLAKIAKALNIDEIIIPK